AGLALALVIVYRSTRAINFAQGEMATFTTFICWSLMNNGLSFWEAFPIVLVLAFAGGVAIERTIIRPVENAPVITIVIVTLGLAITLLGRYVGFIGDTLKLPTALFLILLVLLVKPNGLFGRVAVRRV